jgi:hypothetical protein
MLSCCASRHRPPPVVPFLGLCAPPRPATPCLAVDDIVAVIHVMPNIATIEWTSNFGLVTYDPKTAVRCSPPPHCSFPVLCGVGVPRDNPLRSRSVFATLHHPGAWAQCVACSSTFPS